ncbi:response regulator [bacterium D16-51]|nr:response regulator [bacterium D16-59]RKI60606.1 response regulator [bacterium D16-51]
MKVLIVDDEPFICESIKADFKRMGHPWEYEVYTAQSVALAREIYYGEEPELVITDINMPGGSGLILVSEIHKDNPGCALLVLSAYDDYEYVRNAFMMGAWDYILKPIAFSELKKCVEKLTEKMLAEKEAFCPEKTTESENNNGVFQMKDVVDYIGQHLGEKLNASEMAQKMAVSYSSFGKLFREHMGMSFSAYLLQCRMECAKDYLENSHMKIKQVASKVGYRDNPQHFSRDFMRQTGTSPKEYRAQMLEEHRTS